MRLWNKHDGCELGKSAELRATTFTDMGNLRITATMNLDRDSGEVQVILTATYYHARDRADREIEDVVANDNAGNVVELREDELDEAIELLFVSADEEMMDRALDRAELRRGGFEE